MINEEDGVEELLIIDDEQVDITDLSENDDYLIVQDPTSKKTDDWCVLFVKGEYKDMVVKYEDIGLDTKTGNLSYVYTVLSEEREVNELDFTNYLTSALNRIMLDMHEQGAAAYVDLETKEELAY